MAETHDEHPTDLSSESKITKRKDYLEWEEYFMALAFLAAKRSKDPVTQVGACIVNDNKIIVALGYNGFPVGCNDDFFPWGKEGDPIDTKYYYVCHAELNAILNKNSTSVRGCTIYVGLFPCNECAKCIIQAGIKEVVYFSEKNKVNSHLVASRRMLNAAGVVYRKFIPKTKKIVIDFEDINSNVLCQLPLTPE